MQDNTPALQDEAARQFAICNSCRYCEGYCDVFPQLFALSGTPPAAVSHLANLCHNCRGCFYACQYAPPHEFALNLPAVLAEVRQDSWERHARPQALGRLFHAHGLAMATALMAGFALMLGALAVLRPAGGAGFHAYLAHDAMVAIFAPAFLLPLAMLALSLRSYWREIGGGRITGADLRRVAVSVAQLRNLSGGAGQGCNFEQGARYSNARRHAHQATLWGFVMCFAATASATVMH